MNHVSGHYGWRIHYPFEKRVYGKSAIPVGMDELTSFCESIGGVMLSDTQKKLLEVLRDNNP